MPPPKRGKLPPIPAVPVSLSDHLRLRREKLGLSQRAVDRRLGVRTTSAWSWEHGTAPHRKSWDRIIEFLGYDPRTLRTDAAAD
jgi:transcriptional regulator with XRE-family HTH domain